ncbi:MAG: dienelactone hydrolase family protein [Candidatus Hydrogenedentes bacterium]|nr:dienelactone hydrolase family protein [Candidatus Hydrogenedentota bacterium]
MSLTGFSEFSFTHGGDTRAVYRKGRGPGVVIMHEIPGIIPEVQAFAERVEAEGFTVFLPQLFGEPGKPFSQGYLAQSSLRACISREFSLLAARQSSPICEWLRALCRQVHEELGGRGVGALGMCITGNFALALMVDDAVMAPVLSQPSLPLPIGRKRRCALHLSDEDLAVAKRRASEGVGVLGLRFTHDPLCPPERFERLRDELGEEFEGIEIDSSPGNRYGHPRDAHSVLTRHLVDKEGEPTRAALDRVLAFFRERLIETP